MFSKAKVLFSVGGKFYSRSIWHKNIGDSIFEIARNVTVDLQNIPATMIKLQLYFASEWILISEVTFDSSKFLNVCQFPFVSFCE